MGHSKQKTEDSDEVNRVFESDRPMLSVSLRSLMYLWAGEGLVRVEVGIISLGERTDQRIQSVMWCLVGLDSRVIHHKTNTFVSLTNLW